MSWGDVVVSPFDPQSIEFFHLIARESGKKAHYYPLALKTYDLLPPPHSIEVELGEQRDPKCTPIHLSFGREIDMETFPGSDETDKKTLRSNRAEHIYNLVKESYNLIKE